MLKISAFSKLSRVSVKTLRYYDDLGLLKPAVVDENNGYRYYSAEQLLTVKRIVAFKEQGFTLEQIVPLLNRDVTTEVIRNTLLDKQSELLRSIQEAKQQLDEINTRINNFEKMDVHPTTNKVALRSVAPQLVASVRDKIPRTHLCLLLDEVTQYVRSHGENADGSMTILWHGCDSEDDVSDVEVAIPITHPFPEDRRINIGLLPAVELTASHVHDCDPYNSSCPAEAELASWISSQGYQLSDKEPIREIYLTPDKDMYGRLRKAELLIPIERV